MMRPTMCPYCNESVQHLKPYYDIEIGKVPIFADEKEKPDPSDMIPETTDCWRLRPCGHIFPKDDMDSWMRGDIDVHQLVMGERS